MLTVQNFRKQYEDTLILSIADLTLHPGVHWVKGQNGSGKTTLFKSLSGIIPCTGLVSFDDGISLHKEPVAYRRRVNYSEAEPLYPSFLTPREMMRFVGKAKGATSTQQDELFNKFEITAFQSKNFGACSSGMIKKVSLAMAFAGDPKVIILDEPLITLDEKSRGNLTAMINEYVVERQVICLLSSHQQLDDLGLPLKATYGIQDKTVVVL